MARSTAPVGTIALAILCGAPAPGAPPAQAAPAPAPAPAPTLALGDPAPDLGADVVWLMGMPIGKFEEGKIYALLLWTAGEPPSTGVLPHFEAIRSRVAPSGVQFVSVAFFGSTPEAPAPQDFILDHREHFKHAAAQDNDNLVREKWLWGSGKTSTPVAFVIDKQRRIAFIGDPMLGMEDTINAIASDLFDMEVAKREAARIAVIEEQAAPFLEAANKAAMKRDWAGVLENAERILAIDPVHYYKLTMTKFYITLARLHRPAEAYPYGRKIVEGEISRDHMMLAAMADMIINQAGVAYRDYDLARIAAEKADALTNSASPHVNALLGAAYYNLGDLPRAIAAQEKAVGLATDPARKADYERALATYRGTLTGENPAPAPQPGHEGHDHPHAP